MASCLSNSHFAPSERARASLLRPFGDGTAAETIVDTLSQELGRMPGG